MEIDLSAGDKLKDIERIGAYDGPDRVVDWSTYLEEKKAEHSGATLISTGIPELDHALDQFKTGEVIVLSGITGNGKTLFSKTLIRNMSKEGTGCVVMSFEVSTEEYLTAFRNGAHFDAQVFVPKEMRVGFVKWVYDRALEAKIKFGAKVILVDHLHYIIDMNTDKMTVNIGACMRRLKQLAVELDMVVMVIAHQEKLRDDKEPSIDTLRDSSFVGQEADTVIIVHRLPDESSQKGNDRTYDAGYALVKVDKARRAGTYKRRLTFQKKGAWLEPL